MTQPILFQKAVKDDIHGIMSITGASGSGKTYTALRFAEILSEMDGGRIAVIDTEAGSSRLYADEFDFDFLEWSGPYNINQLVEIIKATKDAGYGVLVIDSLSHFWSFEGGALSEVDRIAREKFSNNSYMAWSQVTPMQEELFRTIVSNRASENGMHVIATMRSKPAYVEEQYQRGNSTKTKYVKVGTAPVQRDNADYEFDVVLQMDHDHIGSVDKTRCRALDGRTFPNPGEEFMETFTEWLRGSANAQEIKDRRQNERETAKNASHASNGMDEWARAMYSYTPVSRAFQNAAGVMMFRSKVTNSDEFKAAENDASFESLMVYIDHLARAFSKQDALDKAVAAYIEAKPNIVTSGKVKLQPSDVVIDSIGAGLADDDISLTDGPGTTDNGIGFGKDASAYLDDLGIDLEPIETGE